MNNFIQKVLGWRRLVFFEITVKGKEVFLHAHEIKQELIS